ncbi:MAG: ABC transporter permease subunit [Coriobacteriales bacterium]|nr:ABC transporter permease [Actinomycetes bacterium]
MRAFGAFLRKESLETVRTWRVWVVGGMLLFFALSGPVLAELTPQILRSVSGTSGMGGLIIEVPDPGWADAYAQWVKNLSQIVTWAIIVMLGGMISSERKKGTATLVLTKPLSRRAFLMAKFVSHSVLIVLATLLGAAVTWLVTLLIFGEAPAGVLAETTAAWLVFAVMLVAVMTLLSALMDSQVSAALLGFGVLAGLGIAGMWEPASRYTPAGLMNAPAALLGGREVATGWPIASAVLVAIVSLAAAAAVFSRKEL